MITHNNNITLDLSCLTPTQTVTAKQDDSGTRYVTATFTDGGKAASLTGVSSAELRCLRPDGGMTATAAEISGDTVTAVLPDNALAVAGRGYGDILLIGAGGEVISAARFILNIKAGAVSNRRVSSSSDFSAYREQVADLTADLADFRSVYSSQMSQMYGKLSELTQRLGAASIKICTAEEYSALTPDPNTVYYVTDGSKVTQYLGGVKLTSGTVSAGSATVMADGTAQAVSGAAQTIEEV